MSLIDLIRRNKGKILAVAIGSVPVLSLATLNLTSYAYISDLLLENKMQVQQIRQKYDSGFKKLSIPKKVLVTAMRPGLELACYLNGGAKDTGIVIIPRKNSPGDACKLHYFEDKLKNVYDATAKSDTHALGHALKPVVKEIGDFYYSHADCREELQWIPEDVGRWAPLPGEKKDKNLNFLSRFTTHRGLVAYAVIREMVKRNPELSSPTRGKESPVMEGMRHVFLEFSDSLDKALE